MGESGSCLTAHLYFCSSICLLWLLILSFNCLFFFFLSQWSASLLLSVTERSHCKSRVQLLLMNATADLSKWFLRGIQACTFCSASAKILAHHSSWCLEKSFHTKFPSLYTFCCEKRRLGLLRYLALLTSRIVVLWLWVVPADECVCLLI